MAKRTGGRQQEAEEEEEEDVVGAEGILDAVLNNLYDFGEPLLAKNKKQKRKRKNSMEKVAETEINNLSEDRYINSEMGAVTPGKKKKSSNFFDNLKDEQAYDSIKQGKSTPEHTCHSTVPLKSNQQGNTAEVEVVMFHGQCQKKKDNDSRVKMVVQQKHASGQEFNLEKARLEVHQFGITGFEKKEQRVLERERAIMLGAKPPKKEYLNYKILQKKIKEKKATKKEEHFVENKSDSLKKQKKKGREERKPKKKTKQSILPSGQVGTFKNGTLVLRSSDIKKIKSSKVIK